MTPTELAENPAVRRWFDSANLADIPAEDQTHRLALLADFCAHTGQQPEELVSGLLRTTKDGDTAISAKRRTVMNATIDEFVEKSGFTGKEAVVNGNIIRSFLVHNGIFIQGRAWRGSGASPAPS
ncbi:MAG TPA: hypothetical protein VG795_07595 [Acidimicrobiia bacterium]|nr:hypothetical protein [Acidimicrobiia bacterium]